MDESGSSARSSPWTRTTRTRARDREGVSGQVPVRGGDRPDERHGGAARSTSSGAQRPAAGAHRPVPGQPAAERQDVLPDLREVHRARPPGVGQYRYSGPADAGRAAATTLPRRGLPVLPRAQADHGARRRPVVGRGHPPAAQVPEPLHDDLGVRAEVPAGRADPVHEHRGQEKILFASDHPVLSFERCLREAEALPLRDGVLEKYLRSNALSVFDWS